MRDICKLRVKPEQEQFVSPNAISIAQAHFSDYAWFRAIYADDTPVGFAMVDDRPHENMAFLWRFMIDARYQRFGFGRRALEQVIDNFRPRPNLEHFLTSVVQAEGGPQPFYESLGFELTGDMVDDEAVLRLALRKSDDAKVLLPTTFSPFVVPALLTHDMPATLEFYRTLGFEVRGRNASEDVATWAEVKRDGVRLQFHTDAPRGTPTEPVCSGTFYLYPSNLADLEKELDGKIAFAWGPETMDYGQREFAVQDPNGYFIAFCEPA